MKHGPKLLRRGRFREAWREPQELRKHKGLKLCGRSPEYRAVAMWQPTSLLQGCGHVVAIQALGFATPEAWTHRMSVGVKDPPAQQRGDRSRGTRATRLNGDGELGLRCIEEITIEDGSMLAGIDCVFVRDLSNVEPI